MALNHKHLENIEAALEEIKENTHVTWYELLLSGLLRGAGVIIGSALTIALTGWGLSLLGVIPGAEEIADYLVQIFSE